MQACCVFLFLKNGNYTQHSDTSKSPPQYLETQEKLAWRCHSKGLARKEDQRSTGFT